MRLTSVPHPVRRWSALTAALVAAACGGGSTPRGPVGPTPPPPVVIPVLSAPTPQSPIDDATVDTVRPILTVANAVSDQPGDKLYEFQVAETPDGFGMPSVGGISISRQGVPEGPDGKTSFQIDQDLPLTKRFFWRARVVQGALAWNGPYSAVARFKTATPAKPVVRIASLTVSSARVEADAEVTLTATVENTDTPIDKLVFEWTADRGTFTGTGSRVRWRAPRNERTPVNVDLRLTVLDRFVVVDVDGNAETRENRASTSTRVRVHDSRAEITDLVMTFLADFSNSNVSPQVCVRNFSDNCPGKLDELSDITANRANYTSITASRFSIGSIDFDSAFTSASIAAPCEFTSIVRATGRTEVARGTCLLDAVYENSRWWLCNSLFRGTVTSGIRFLF